MDKDKGNKIANRVYYVLAAALLLFTPMMAAKANDNTPSGNGWGNSVGKIVYQQAEDSTKQVVYDTSDLQQLYNLAK